ncbi:YhdP family protein [Alsobacter sp. R-9]
MTTGRIDASEVLDEASQDGCAPVVRLRATRRRRPKSRKAGVVLRVLRVLATAVVLVAVGVVALVWRLQSGPVSVDALTERVTSALEDQFGEGFDVTVRHSQLQWTDHGPQLSVTGVAVRDAQGNLVVAAPQADVAFDATGLAFGQLKPRDIQFIGPAVALTIAADGAVSVSATGEEEPPRSEGEAPTPRSGFGPAALLDPLLLRAGPLAVLERAGIRDGRLRVNDLRRGRSVTYDRLTMQFSRPTAGETDVRVSARGPLGSWSAQATVSGTPGGERTLRVGVDNVSVAEFIGLSQPGSIPAMTDMPLRGAMELSLGPDNGVTAFEARITGGSAIVMFDHPDFEPILVDSVRGQFGWDAKEHAVLVTSLELAAGDTQWRLQGRVSVPQTDDAMWAIELGSSDSAMAGDGPQDKPVQIDRLEIRGRMPIGLGGLRIDTLEATGPQLALAMTGQFGRFDGQDGLQLGLTTGRMPVRNVLAFWPSIVASDARTWMLANVEGGTVESFRLATSLSPQALADAFSERPLPDDSVRLDVSVTGGVLRIGPGMPTIGNVTAKGEVTGRTIRVTASGGQIGSASHGIRLSNVNVRSDDTAAKPPVLQIEGEAAGALDSLLEALRSNGLKPFLSLPAELAAGKGTFEAKMSLGLPLAPAIRPKDVALRVSGQASGVAIDNLGGREKLEGGTFTFAQDKAGLSIKGDARLGGSPAALELKAPAGGPMEASAVLTLDEAARNRRGLRLPGHLTGPVELRVTVADATGPRPTTRVEADLAKAVVTDVLPGWTKPAGRPGKVSFRVESDGDATALEDLVLDAAGGVQAKGSLRLGADGTPQQIRFTTLRIAPGDDIKLDAERTAAGAVKATVRAGQIDARPLIRAVMAPGGPQVSNPGDLDLDLKAQTVLGENNEKLTGADLKLSLRGGDVRDLRMTGRFGNSPVAGQPARSESGASGFVVESGDAGSFLRFFDIYRRMIGGTLILQVYGGPGQMNGEILANSFSLANEPALARVAQGDPERGNSVAFTKLRAGFTVGGGRLEIRDGTMWGPAVGGTLEGAMDYARDRVDLSGTFVPAYGLNNALNRVPIVGTLLGGGKDEGIFAVNFRITGRVTQPSLSINPLSAVAPGVLRKFFGVFGGSGGTQESAAQRPAPPPAVVGSDR